MNDTKYLMYKDILNAIFCDLECNCNYNVVVYNDMQNSPGQTPSFYVVDQPALLKKETISGILIVNNDEDVPNILCCVSAIKNKVDDNLTIKKVKIISVQKIPQTDETSYITKVMYDVSLEISFDIK